MREIIEIIPKIEIETDKMLANVYTPGVAKSCLKIKENIDRVFDLTNRSNSVAVFSYVYEKAYERAIFIKKTKNVDAYPFEIKKTTKEDLDFVIKNIIPNFMGVDTKLLENEPVFASFDIPTQSKNCIFGDNTKKEDMDPVELRKLLGGVIEIQISMGEKIQKPVGIVTDGSAVLGLGNIGSTAGLPVMEGKAALFKRFSNVNAMPLCLLTQDKDEIIKIVQLLENSFSGINLEDITAPRCFEVENTLIETTSIPIFHDDQHGTAIVVTAGLLNALSIVKKDIQNAKITICGAGSAGQAITKLLLKIGAQNIIMVDINGIVRKNNPKNNPFTEELANLTNKENLNGGLDEAIKGADVFIGVSAGNILKKEHIAKMATDPIVFALANPTPEIMPDVAKSAGAKITASGRSDFANQINNCLAFPGLFDGVIKSGCKKITNDIKIQCALGIASMVDEDELDVDYIIPKALDSRVAKNISACIIEYVRK